MTQADIQFAAQAFFGGLAIVAVTAAVLADWQARADRKAQRRAAIARKHAEQVSE